MLNMASSEEGELLSGAEIIVRLLERQGIRTLSGIPGGAALPLYDALSQSELLHHVLARHEQGAGFIAQGMSRVTGDPQVCIATSGPGATNIMTAIADARLDSIPLVCITGQVPLSLIGTDAFQEVDTYGMSIPITKHNYLVRSAEELLQVIPEAFRLAASGRPGPVLVDVPKDVQNAKIHVHHWPEPAVRDEPPAVDAEAVANAARMINESERPLLYIGGGAVNSPGAAELLREWVDNANLPAVSTLMALGILPTDHPRALGMLGMHGASFTHDVLDRTDLIVVCGARFDDRATGKVAEFCPDAKVIHIDIDPSEHHKIKAAHQAVAGDVATTLEALIPEVKVRDHSEWLAEIDGYRERAPLTLPGEDDATRAYGLIRHVAKSVGPEAVVVTDVGQHQMWTAQAYPFTRPRQWLTSGGLGTMGFGVPTAIGAALGAPDRPVVCFTGDGSIMMNIQELATALEQNVNLKIVLLNNQALGLVHQQQSLFYEQRHFAIDLSVAPDFAALAKAFGMAAWDLADCNSEQAAETLDKAIQTTGPALIHCPVDLAEQVFPMVPPGAANREALDPHNETTAEEKRDAAVA